MSNSHNKVWPATFGDGVVCQNQQELDRYLIGTVPYLPISHGSDLDTQICFAVGELAREQLEETASNADVEFDKWTSNDELRALVIDAARSFGGLTVYDAEGGTSTFGFDDESPPPIHDPMGCVPIPPRSATEGVGA